MSQIKEHYKKANALKSQFVEERKRDDHYTHMLSTQIKCADPMIEKFNRHVTSGNFMENVESKVKANRITMELERKHSRKGVRKGRRSDVMSLSPAKQKSIIEEESSSSNSVSSCSSSSIIVEDLDDLGDLDAPT